VKQILAREFGAEILDILSKFADCQGDMLIELCSARGGRRPNARAQFIGGCIREQYAKNKRPVTELMKECSTEWRTQKKS